MGEPEEELRKAVRALELRADQRTAVCSNPVVTNSFLRRSNEIERPPARFSLERD